MLTRADSCATLECRPGRPLCMSSYPCTVLHANIFDIPAKSTVPDMRRPEERIRLLYRRYFTGRNILLQRYAPIYKDRYNIIGGEHSLCIVKFVP